ncbi:MAG: hypothetical protein WC516_06470 [Patescibacteria group bacterium]|jgi:hypothetical protein
MDTKEIVRKEHIAVKIGKSPIYFRGEKWYNPVTKQEHTVAEIVAGVEDFIEVVKRLREDFHDMPVVARNLSLAITHAEDALLRFSIDNVPMPSPVIDNVGGESKKIFFDEVELKWYEYGKEVNRPGENGNKTL